MAWQIASVPLWASVIFLLWRSLFVAAVLLRRQGLPEDHLILLALICAAGFLFGVAARMVS